MSTIDQLNAINTLSASDLLLAYSSSNGDTRKISAYNAAVSMAAMIVASGGFVTQYAAPLTGSTVIVNGLATSVQSNNVWLILTPAGTLATLTIQLPPAVSCVDKQELLFVTTQTLTAITWVCLGGNVVSPPSTLTPPTTGWVRLKFDAVTLTWYRV